MNVLLYLFAAVLLIEIRAYRSYWMQFLIFMPAPTDIPAIKGVDLEGNEVERHSSDDEPFAALSI